MKKPVIAIMAVILSLALFGCSNNSVQTEKETEATVETTTEQTTADVTESETSTETTEAPVQAGPQVNITVDGGKTIFNVSTVAEFTDRAWLGMVPAGKEYVSESEARSERIFCVWVERSSGKAATDPYVFIYSGEDIAMLPQGEFTMVLCDGEDNGKIILQFPVTVSGVEIKCDLDKMKVN